MTKISPMLNHAIESFQHGIEHYLDGTVTSRKFSILHIDQAIELFLKEKVALIGKSIYKSDGQTLSFHECLSSLKDVKIPEFARLQEIHDLRNVIQHKGMTPDEKSTQYFVEMAYKFIKRFSAAELSMDFNDILPDRYMKLMEPDTSMHILPDIKHIPSVDFNYGISTVEQIVNAYVVLEVYVSLWQNRNPQFVEFRSTINELVVDNGHDSQEVAKQLMTVTLLKSRVTHTDYIPSENETKEYLNLVNNITLMMSLKREALEQYEAQKTNWVIK